MDLDTYKRIRTLADDALKRQALERRAFEHHKYRGEAAPLRPKDRQAENPEGQAGSDREGT